MIRVRSAWPCVMVMLSLYSLPLSAAAAADTETDQAKPTEKADVQALLDRGDARAREGDFQAALAAFLDAREAAPDRPGVHIRIAAAAQEVGEKRLGLDAIVRYLQLLPAKKNDPAIADLRRRLRNLSAPLSDDPQEALEVRTIQLIVDDMIQAVADGNGDWARGLADEAHKRLLPLVADLHQHNVEVWRLLGVTAQQRDDDRHAAWALEAIGRLYPDYANDEALFDLMAELNRRDVEKPLAERRYALKTFASAGAGQLEAIKNMGNMCFDGEGVTKNDQEALKWWLTAASAGHGEAMNNVGFAYGNCLAYPPRLRRTGAGVGRGG